MTATVLLVRHAAHAHLGAVLSGRTAGGSLTAAGLEQARRLGRGLAPEAVRAVYTSPVARARETAAQIAQAHGLTPVVAEPLDEVEFGEWTGRSFDELASDPAWEVWNTRRATAGAPGGETMQEVQDRAFAYLMEAAARHGSETIVLVSHCDVIRAVVAAVLGLSLDNMLRFDIDAASVTAMAAGTWGARLVSLNRVF